MRRDCRVITEALDELENNSAGNTPKSAEAVRFQSIATGLHILEERSIGMVEFVTKFRNLTLLPKPTFSTFSITELLANIRVLMNEKINKRGIDVEIKVPYENMQITADRSMVEQILINLISNAIYALEGIDTPRIWLIAKVDENDKPLLIVADNGKGIPEEIRDKIFIPFFSTRKDGSGIGLSLSRQMMRLHGGTLTMTSTPGEMTVFTLKW